MRKITVDEWQHIKAGERVEDGYGDYRTAPFSPGIYTLYELADENLTHRGWEWAKEAPETTYNYLDALEDDILEYIMENDIEITEDMDLDDIAEELNEKLLICDSVTGNASGSYTFNSLEAKMYVLDNVELIREVTLGWMTPEEVGEKFMNEEWEFFDVAIRCYFLWSALTDVLGQIEAEGLPTCGERWYTRFKEVAGWVLLRQGKMLV